MISKFVMTNKGICRVVRKSENGRSLFVKTTEGSASVYSEIDRSMIEELDAKKINQYLLKLTITDWQKAIAEDEVIPRFPRFCYEHLGNDCLGCPVRAFSGLPNCEGTILREALKGYSRVKEGTVQEAFKVLLFLRQLKGRLEYA